MAQILDPVPSDRPGPIVCCYVNATSKIQIARITNIANWYFERVVFPGQRLVFEAFSDALLEIHTGMMATAILSDKIPCNRLQISEHKHTALEPVQDFNEPSVTLKTALENSAKSRNTNRTLMAAALTSVD